MMREADLVVLCLPDDAAQEAVALADALGADAPEDPRCLDRASRRTRLGLWLRRDGRRAGGRDRRAPSASPTRAAIPTGAIALIRPLVDAGLMPADYPAHRQRGERLLAAAGAA